MLKAIEKYIEYPEPVNSLTTSQAIHRFFIAFSQPFLGILLWMLILGFLPATSTTVQAKGIGPQDAFYLVHDYRDDWQVFDERYNAYVPYVHEVHKGYSSYSLFFDIENYKSYKLLYYSPKENYLFIDATLQRKLPVDSWVVIDIDSLQRVYHKTAFFLTFYGSNTGIEHLSVQIGNKIPDLKNDIELSDSLLTVVPRTLSPFQNFLALCLLFLGCLYAILYNYQPKEFSRYYSLRELLTIGVRDDSLGVNKPFYLANFIFVVVLSFTMAYILELIQHEETDIFAISSILQEEESLLSFISNFFEIAVIVFIFLLLKYIALIVLTNLYRLDNIVNIHFFKVIQASSIFFLGLAIFLTFSIFSYPEIIKNAEKYLFIPISLFFILRLLLIYFTINKMTVLKRFYLFSYLCIVELIPLVAGIRFAL